MVLGSSMHWWENSTKFFQVNANIAPSGGKDTKKYEFCHFNTIVANKCCLRLKYALTKSIN